MTTYKMPNTYTLLAVDATDDGGKLSRYFNFAAETVTTLYERKETMSLGYNSAPAAAAALTSQMQIQKFSEFDTDTEMRMMREELVKKGGTPPENDRLGKGKIPSPASALK